MPKISALTAGVTGTGAETYPAVQSGTTVRLTSDQIFNTISTKRSIPLAYFGVVANGVTDDTAAVNAAIAYANANGGNVTFIVPRGTTTVTTTTAITAAAVYFRGDGAPEHCTLKYSGSPGFTWGTTLVAAAFGGMKDLGLQGPGSAGVAISSPYSAILQFQNLYLTTVDTLLELGSTTTTVNGVLVDNLIGIVFGSGNPLIHCINGAGLTVTNASVSANLGAGRGFVLADTRGWDTIQVYDCLLQRFAYVCKATADNGYIISSLTFSNVIADACGNDGYLLTANAGGGIASTRIHGCGGILTSGGTGTGYGIKLTGAGGIVNTAIRDLLISGFGKSAVFCDATTVTDLFIEQCESYSNNFTAGANNEIDIAGGAGYSRISLINNTVHVTNGVIGIKFGAAIDHLRVIGNDIAAAVTNYDGMAAGTTNTFAHTNYTQIGNVGLIAATLQSMQILKGTAIPAGGTAGSGYLLSSTTNFGIFFGSSAPTLSAAKGSIYLRSDGTGVNDRAYINTNGTTTWTAIVTTDLLYPPFYIITSTAINFNSANTDTSITITLPQEFTRYRLEGITINHASASISTATCGVFSAAAAAGTAVVTSGTAITVTSASENTVNNMQSLLVNNQTTASYNFATLFFRVQTAQGSAATADVAIAIRPIS